MINTQVNINAITRNKQAMEDLNKVLEHSRENFNNALEELKCFNKKYKTEVSIYKGYGKNVTDIDIYTYGKTAFIMLKAVQFDLVIVDGVIAEQPIVNKVVAAI